MHDSAAAAGDARLLFAYLNLQKYERRLKFMYRILIADDEVIERKVLIKKLKGMFEGQLEIYEAENGREVLRIHREKAIQIMLLDIEMPGVTGLEAAEQIQKEDRNCCIIFLTAFDEFNYARRAIKVHALDYLLKPCDELELAFSVEAAMKYTDDVNSGHMSVYPLLEHTDPAEQESPENRPEDGTERNGLRGKILAYIDRNYMKDLSVQNIAEDFCYSEAYFFKLFKQEFQQSFITNLTMYRIEHAKKQLAMPSVNIKDIGKSVGYPDSNYFAKVFRRVVGDSPSDYRARILESAQRS